MILNQHLVFVSQNWFQDTIWLKHTENNTISPPPPPTNKKSGKNIQVLALLLKFEFSFRQKKLLIDFHNPLCFINYKKIEAIDFMLMLSSFSLANNYKQILIMNIHNLQTHQVPLPYHFPSLVPSCF
jgi:hypothetical protein